jgi:hypothetical protein
MAVWNFSLGGSYTSDSSRYLSGELFWPFGHVSPLILVLDNFALGSVHLKEHFL